MKRKLCIGLVALVATASLASCADSNYNSSDSDTGTTELFGSQFCEQEASRMVQEHPDLYYSRQEAYDSCREARNVADELEGKIKK